MKSLRAVVKTESRINRAPRRAGRRFAHPLLLASILVALAGVVPAQAQDGWPDPAFGSNGMVWTSFTGLSSAFRPDENDGSWTSVVEQPDGSTLLAGHVGFVGDGRVCYETVVARLREDGSLDPSFGSGGVTAFLPGCAGATGAQRIVLQPDGRIVGFTAPTHQEHPTQFVLFRLLPDGSPDPSFGAFGFRVESLPRDWISGWPKLFPADLALQSDGSIVLAGTVFYSDTSMDTDFVVARFLADGSPDPGFGIRGFMIVDFAIGNSYDLASGVAIQSDGRIVVAGTVQSGSPQRDFGLARLLPDGFPDPSFGYGARSILSGIGFGSFNFASSVALQPGGNIVLAGRAMRTGPDEIPEKLDIVVARALPNGALDPTFGFGGWAPVGYSDVETVSRVAVQGDGKLVVAATRETGGVIVRLLPEGGADLDFGSWGSTEAVIELPTPVNDLALGWMGRILVAGRASRLWVSRLTNWVRPWPEEPGH